MAKPLIATFLALALAGCGGFAQMGRARTLDPGQWEFGAGLTLVGKVDPSYVPGDPPAADSYISPGGFSPELTVGVGATPRIELGVRAYPLGGELGVKAQLLRGQVVDLAIAPSVFAGLYQRPGDEGGVYARLPILAGINLGARTSIVLAPEAAWALDSGGDPLPELWGGTAAVHHRAQDGTQLALGVTWLRFGRRVPLPSDPAGALERTEIWALSVRGGFVRGGAD
jgi:hypothetical protein